MTSGAKPHVTVVYAGFLRNPGGVATHTRLLISALTHAGYTAEALSLESVPYIARFIPHLAWYALRPIDGVLAIYAKQTLIRWLMRSVARRRNNGLLIFQDIYIPWSTPGNKLVVLHALWSDNLQSLRTASLAVRLLGRWEAALLNRTAASVVTVSEPYRAHVTAYLANFGLTKRIDVVEPGTTSVNNTAPVMPRKRVGEQLRMLFVGALEHRKNIPLLLKVTTELVKRGVRANLEVVGGGPLARELVNLAQVQGLAEIVTFHGPLPPSEVVKQMERADVYVHTSVKESFSFALLEAKCAGLLTVAHRGLEVPARFIDAPVDTWREGDWADAIQSVPTKEPQAFPAQDYGVAAFATRLQAYLEVGVHAQPTA